MIQETLSAMITLLMAKFILNDVPHAVGLLENAGYCMLYHSTPKSIWEEHIRYEGLVPQSLRTWRPDDPEYGLYLGTSKRSTIYFTEANFYGAPEVLAEELPKWEPWALLEVKVPANIRIEPDEEFILEDGTYGSKIIREPILLKDIKLIGWITPSFERAKEWAETEWVI